MKTNRNQTESRRDVKRDKSSPRASIRDARKAKAATRKALAYANASA